MPKDNSNIGNYHLIRLLEKSNFEEVWLCALTVNGSLRILKFVTGANAEILEKKYAALLRYRELSERAGSPHLMPVEHCEQTAGGFFYILPVPDSDNGKPAESLDRNPRTLASRIERRCRQLREFKWFSGAEIKMHFLPILDALELLAAENLTHGNVNPKEIFYLNGQPCLSEICLCDDASEKSPYRTPANYSGAPADMFGAALTLFAFLTGNNPQKVARASYHCPPTGRTKLRPSERREWQRLCELILRATGKSKAKKFESFSAFKKEIQKDAKARQRSIRKILFPAATAAALAAIAAIVAFYGHKKQLAENPFKTAPAQLPDTPHALPEIEKNAVENALMAQPPENEPAKSP